MHLSDRYPQLSLPIAAGMRNTQPFKDRVLRGEPVPEEESFSLLTDERFFSVETPAGAAEVLLIPGRERFEYCYRALAYRSEPEPIPATVGAVCVSGLINWEKIRTHRADYLAAGGTDWSTEFRSFTADKRNYTDSILLLSGGPYSDLPAEKAGLSGEEWRGKSVTVREYHELTHFVMRRLYPQDKDAVRDEVLADCIGVYAAFGACEAQLVRMFLGLENGKYDGKGRLSFYAAPETVDAEAQRAEAFLQQYADGLNALEKTEPLDALLKIFP